MESAKARARRFWLLWFGSVAGFLAGSISKLALPIYAAKETGSPALVSLVVFGFTAPRLLLGLPLGLLVDRLDRRLLLTVAYGFRVLALVMLGVAAFVGEGQVVAAVLAAAMIGSAEIVDEPAVTAAVPSIVEPRELDSANRRFVAAEIVVDVVSQPLAGLVIGLGLIVAVMTGSAIYLAGIAGLLLIAGSFRPPRAASAPILSDIVAGMAAIWRQPVLRSITLMAGVINASWTAWMVAFIVHALEPGPMGLSEWQLGLLLGADGLGGALGIASVGFVLARLGRRWAIGINILGNALMFLTPLLTVNLWLTGLAVAIGGVGAPLWGVVTRTMQQRIAPDYLIGRVSSAYRTIAFGANALGTVIGGAIGQAIGLDAVFLGASVLTLAMLIPFQRGVTRMAIVQAES